VEKVIDEDPLYVRMVPDAATRRYLLDAMESLPLPAPIAGHVTVAQARYPGFFQHMLAATWVMVALSCDRLSLKYDIGQAAAAGLLHDIAMLHLDARLMDPTVALDEPLRQQLYRHAQLTQALLERHHCYDNNTLTAIWEHHEAMDGSGYPRQLTGHAISPMGKHLAITEVITAFMGKRPDSGELRLGVLLRMNLHRYDRSLIERVLALLNPAQDSRSTQVRVIERPVDALMNMARHIDDWMDVQPDQASLGADGAQTFQRMSAQLAQLQRNLAEAGITQGQLDLIGQVNEDELLLRELSLLALEANWQLHAIAQWACRNGPLDRSRQDSTFCRQWTDRAIELTVPLLSIGQPQKFT
jgi:hypothetical protein